MTALRLARALPGAARSSVRGCYHGHGDSLLVKAGSGALTFGQPSSAACRRRSRRDVVVPYNDLAAVEAAFRAAPDASPVSSSSHCGNMNLVRPKPGFLEGLRALCDRYGAVLIFDEVMTASASIAGVQG